MTSNLKNLLVAAALAAATTAACAADVDVSISVGDPGFYGRLDIGNYPQPVVIYRRPMAVWQVPADRPPIYLRVPPGHAKHWSKHCREYNACDEWVLFVQDNWYTREYLPRYQVQHHERRDEHGDDRDGAHENDRRGDRQDHGRGH